jgi:hypothetical protein
MEITASQEKEIKGAEAKKRAFRELIETEIRGIIDEELRKAAEELMEEQRTLIRQMVEEQKRLIREVVEEEKKLIFERVEELRESISKIGLR